MDHDKQVTDLVQVTRDRFLNQPLSSDGHDQHTFDLEAEFAKSAKNRSLMIPAAVAAFLAVLAIGAWIASQYTDQASAKSSVSIGSFEDLNLKEIFDTARRNKKDLEDIQAQMDQLTQASNARVTAIQQAGASQADIAQVNDASGDQAKAIQAETAQKVAVEKSALAQSLKPLKAQAADVQKKIDSYDTRIGKMEQKNKQILDTQQRLFDLEKQKIVDQYEVRIASQKSTNDATVSRLMKERDDLVAALQAKHAAQIRKLILKYNPILTDADVVAVLKSFEGHPADYPGFQLPDRIAAANVIPSSQQQDLAAKVARTQMLLDQLKKIPSENSVPPLVNALDNSIADTLAGLASFLTPLATNMNYLDSIIVDRDSTIVNRDVAILQQKADYDVEVARLGENLAKAHDEFQAQTAWLARWTSSVTGFVETLRDQDGVLVDVSDSSDWMVVIKRDRTAQLQAAINAYQVALTKAKDAGVDEKKLPKPVNLATVRDGLNNSEVASVSLEATTYGWRATLIKLRDPKRAVKALDRLVLDLPKKR